MFVTGCHRSGTSLITALLIDLLQISESERGPQLEPKFENPLGFFETQRLTNANDELLSHIQCSWDSPPVLVPNWSASKMMDLLIRLRSRFSQYALSGKWIDKDPRLCLTYPAYIHILLKRVPIVAILRSPFEVATSLYARNGFQLDVGLLLWYIYNHHLAFSLQEEDLLLSYESLLELKESPSLSKNRNLNLINRFIESFDQQSPSDNSWESAINKRIIPSLNRSEFSLSNLKEDEINSKLYETCMSSYKIIEESNFSIKVYQEVFSSLTKPILQSLQRVQGNNTFSFNTNGGNNFYNSSLHKNHELQEAKNKINSLEIDLQATYDSTSWKITAPMRWLAEIIRSS